MRLIGYLVVLCLVLVIEETGVGLADCWLLLLLNAADDADAVEI